MYRLIAISIHKMGITDFFSDIYASMGFQEVHADAPKDDKDDDDSNEEGGDDKGEGEDKEGGDEGGDDKEEGGDEEGGGEEEGGEEEEEEEEEEPVDPKTKLEEGESISSDRECMSGQSS